MQPRHHRTAVIATSVMTVFLLFLLMASFMPRTTYGEGRYQSTPSATPNAHPHGNMYEAGFNLDQALLMHRWAREVYNDSTDGDYTLSALLAIRSLQAAYTVEADFALAWVMDGLRNGYQTYDLATDIYQMSLSPDGRYLLLVERAGEVHLVDVQTGIKVTTIALDRVAIQSVAFSPDGTQILLVGLDLQVRLWDMATQDETVLFDMPTEVSYLMFSPDGQMAIAADASRTVKVWDIAANHLARFAETPFGDAMSGVAISPDGQTIFMTGTNGLAQLVDVATGEVQYQYFDDAVFLNSPLFSADSQQVIALKDYSEVVQWEVADFGSPVALYTTEASGLMTPSADGRYLVGSAWDRRSLFVWDSTTGELVDRADDYEWGVQSVAFSPDNTSLFVLGGDGVVWRRPFHVPLVESHPHYLVNNVGYIMMVAYSPDGQWAAVGYGDSTLAVWDVTAETLAWQTQLPEGEYPYLMNGLGFTSDGRVYSIDADGQVDFWAAATGEHLSSASLDARGFYDASLSPDDQLLAFSQGGNEVRFFDFASDNPAPSFQVRNGSAIQLAFSPNGKLLAVGGTDKRVRIWDLKTQEVATVLGEFEAEPDGLVFSPDGRQLLMGFIGQNGLQLVDIESGEVVGRFVSPNDDSGFYAGSFQASFSADGRLIVASLSDGAVLMWDVATFEVVRAFTNFNQQLVNAVMRPDGQQVLTGAFDGTARLWTVDLATYLTEVCLELGRDFSPEELARFRLTAAPTTCPNLAAGTDAVVPTWTPNPINTLPVWTPLPTLLPTFTPTLIPSLTPRPTSAPVTPPPAGSSSELRGEVTLLGKQTWEYTGTPDGLVNIYVRADQPANGADAATIASDNLLDTRLVILSAATGSIMETNNDIESGVQSDSAIIGLELPRSGRIIIEVSSAAGEGAYTLVIETVPIGDGIPTPTSMP